MAIDILEALRNQANWVAARHRHLLEETVVWRYHGWIPWNVRENWEDVSAAQIRNIEERERTYKERTGLTSMESTNPVVDIAELKVKATTIEVDYEIQLLQLVWFLPGFYPSTFYQWNNTLPTPSNLRLLGISNQTIALCKSNIIREILTIVELMGLNDPRPRLAITLKVLHQRLKLTMNSTGGTESQVYWREH